VQTLSLPYSKHQSEATRETRSSKGSMKKEISKLLKEVGKIRKKSQTVELEANKIETLSIKKDANSKTPDSKYERSFNYELTMKDVGSLI